MVPFMDANGNALRIHATSKYTRLGAIQSATMTYDAKVTMRIIKVRSAYRDIKRKILGNPAIEMQKKCYLAQMIIFSRLLFGTEVWNGLHPKQEAKLNTIVFHLYGTIVKKISKGNEQKFSNLEVEASLICTKIQGLIRLQRLRYFRKVGDEAPLLLVKLLEREDQEKQVSWFGLIREDLEWVAKLSKDKTDRYQGMEDLRDWWRMVMSQGKAWDKHITKLVMQEALAEHILAKQKW